METVDGVTVRILDATYDALAAGGARRTTVNEIADAAGLGIATVYRRFPRKALLIRAVVIREAARLTATVAAAVEQESTVEGQASAGFSVFAKAVAAHPFLVRILRGSEEDGDVVAAGELADELMAVASDYLAAWVRVLQAQGRYLQVDADVVAEMQARLAFSLIISPSGKIKMDDEAGARSLVSQYVIRLLGPEH